MTDVFEKSDSTQAKSWLSSARWSCAQTHHQNIGTDSSTVGIADLVRCLRQGGFQTLLFQEVWWFRHWHLLAKIRLEAAHNHYWTQRATAYLPTEYSPTYTNSDLRFCQMAHRAIPCEIDPQASEQPNLLWSSLALWAMTSVKQGSPLQ